MTDGYARVSTDDQNHALYMGQFARYGGTMTHLHTCTYRAKRVVPPRMYADHRESRPQGSPPCNTKGQSVPALVVSCCSTCSERVRCALSFATSSTVRFLHEHSPRPAHVRSREGAR